MSKPRLLVIVASTRPGRIGPSVGDWFAAQAAGHGAFEVEVADLAELALPFMDEPIHPAMRAYEHEHTKRWSATVDAADAFVFVTPEYNFTFTAPLKNALDYLYHEWARKPAGIVSYGGASGGMRATQALKPVLTTLKMMPLPEGVAIHGVHAKIEDGAFIPDEGTTRAAGTMLDELTLWAGTLANMREQVATPV